MSVADSFARGLRKSARPTLKNASTSLQDVALRNKALADNSRDLSTVLKARFEKEMQDALHSIINDYPQPVTRNDSRLKSAVGIVLKGRFVDFFLPGVPASRVLRKGDEIVEIDGLLT